MQHGKRSINSSSTRTLKALAAAILVAGAFAEPVMASASRLYNQGLFFAKQNRFREALPYFDAAIKELPTFAEPYVNKGVCLDSLGMHEKAIECYDKAIKLSPRLSVAYDNRGTAKLALRRYAEALEDFNKSIALPRVSPLGSVYIYSDRARAYAGLGRWKECFRDFEYVLNYKSTDQRMETLKRMAGVYYRAAQLQFAAAIAGYADEGEKSLRGGDYQKAIELFDKSLSLKPRQVEVVALKARTYLESGQIDRALETAGKAIEMDPRRAPLRVARAKIYLGARRYKEAQDDLSEALTLGLRNAESYRLRAIARFLSGQAEAATEDVCEAIRHDGKDRDSYLTRSLTATAAGDAATAMADAMKYLELTQWNGPSAGEAVALAYFARAKAENETSAREIFDLRPKDGEFDKFCQAGPMIELLKKEKTEKEIMPSCSSPKEKEAVEIVGAWMRLAVSPGDQDAMSLIKSYLASGNPLESPYLLAAAVQKQIESGKTAPLAVEARDESKSKTKTNEP